MGINKKNNRKNIETAVKKSLAAYFNIPASNIKADARLIEDLGLDSFGLVELRFELKKAFGVEIAKEDFGSLSAVHDIIDYIMSHSSDA